MAKINILDSYIYNRISAGEVVERPASVVKEAVENSIDAGAKNITIEIKCGGKKLIKIVDDGCGIDYEDLEKAFLPHATSKISKIDDLDSIKTMGFRGEALATIASVSKIELISKTENCDYAGKICLEGGKILSKTECGAPEGTTFIIKDLFFNTPARLKFLKSDKQEESFITNIINKLLLANNNVNFKYIVDNKIIYNSTISGLKNKIYTIYGKETFDNLIEINATKDNLKLSGYISMPSFCKANKTYQTLLVNNRYVVNSLISTAVHNAYENFLMKGKFPFFVLNFAIDYEKVDVNIHPSKMEVKFDETGKIYSFFYSTILNALNENNCPTAFENLVDEGNNIEPLCDEKSLDTMNATYSKDIKGFSFSDLSNIKNEINSITMSNEFEAKSDKNVSKLASNFFDFEGEDFSENKNLKKNNENLNLFNIKNENNLDLTENNDISSVALGYKIVGTVFNTYILIESNNLLYIIDQHAGHERVLFDNFMKDFEDKKIVSQPMLIPYIFNVNEEEKLLIKANRETISSIGFSIEEFGYNTYKIDSIPSILSDINLEEFVFDVLKDINKISSTNNAIKDYFAKKACKAAVKAGQDLTREEIDYLLNEILSKKTILLCPHGRPICITMKKDDFEKMFKRIV